MTTHAGARGSRSDAPESPPPSGAPAPIHKADGDGSFGPGSAARPPLAGMPGEFAIGQSLETGTAALPILTPADYEQMRTNPTWPLVMVHGQDYETLRRFFGFEDRRRTKR
jgi:hypothetical protein